MGSLKATSAEKVLLAGVAVVPLVFMPGLFLDPFNIPKLTTLGIVVGATLALTAFARIGAKDEEAASPNPGLAIPAALFAVPISLAWIFSPVQGETVIGKYQNLQGLVPSLLLVAFALLLAHHLYGKASQALFVLAAAGTIVATYGFSQSMGFDPFRLVYEGRTSIAPTSTLGNTNFSGGFLAIVLPLSLVYWEKQTWVRYAGMAATTIIGLTLILTFSQGAWAAAIGGSVTTVLLRSSRSSRQSRKLAVLVVAGTATALVASVALLNFGIKLPTAGGGSTERAFLWNSALDMAADRPVTGWGPDAYFLTVPPYVSAAEYVAYPYRSPEDPHSVPLATAANTGAIGVVGMVGILVWIIARIRRMDEWTLVAAGLAGAIAAYWLQSLVSIDQYSLRFTYWVLLASLAAATGRGRAMPRRKQPLLWSKVVGLTAGGGAVLLMTGSVLLAVADIKARAATDPGGDHDLERGRQLLMESLAIREESQYRELLVRWVAAGLIDAEDNEVLRKMGFAFRGFEESTNSQAMLLYGRLLHYVAPDDEAVLQEAIQWLRRADHLDPNNPLLDIEHADALITYGQPAEATDLLRSIAIQAPGVGDAYKEYWPVAATALLASGEHSAAAAAADSARQKHPNSCQASAVQELVRNQSEEYKPDSSTLLTLSIQCDAEYYNLFLHRLPPDKRPFYI